MHDTALGPSERLYIEPAAPVLPIKTQLGVKRSDAGLPKLRLPRGSSEFLRRRVSHPASRELLNSLLLPTYLTEVLTWDSSQPTCELLTGFNLPATRPYVSFEGSYGEGRKERDIVCGLTCAARAPEEVSGVLEDWLPSSAALAELR